MIPSATSSPADPEQFQRCFMEWVVALTQGEVVAIDAKTVAALPDRTLGKKAIHMVNVWASSLALGQTKVDEKSQRSCWSSPVASSIDAMGCQREIARGSLRLRPTICWRIKAGCTMTTFWESRGRPL